jgi:YidC/Oxa1 family membrane protein insertase
LGPRPYLGAALTTNDERYYKLKFTSLDKEEFKQTVTGGWAAIVQHYFISAWVANAEDENHYFGRKREDGDYVVGFTGPVQSVAPGATGHFTSSFYAGPKDQGRLEAIAPGSLMPSWSIWPDLSSL